MLLLEGLLHGFQTQVNLKLLIPKLLQFRFPMIRKYTFNSVFNNYFILCSPKGVATLQVNFTND